MSDGVLTGSTGALLELTGHIISDSDSKLPILGSRLNTNRGVPYCSAENVFFYSCLGEKKRRRNDVKKLLLMMSH